MSSKYRKADGTLHDFDVIKGESAYESYVIGGGTKTEAEFYQMLGSLASKDDVNNAKDYADTKVNSAKTEINTTIDTKVNAAKAELNATISNILPTFTAEDEGKVLGISSGVLAWVDKA